MYRVCAIAVGGLTSPVKGPYAEPLYFADKPPDSLPLNNSSLDYEDEEEHKESVEKVITAERKTKELGDDNEEKEAESKRGPPFCPQTLISEPNHKKNNKITTVSESELRKLERGEVSLGVRLTFLFFVFVKMFELYSLFPCMFADFYLSSLSQLHSAKMQEQLWSRLSSDPYSNWEPWDKKVTHNSP